MVKEEYCKLSHIEEYKRTMLLLKLSLNEDYNDERVDRLYEGLMLALDQVEKLSTLQDKHLAYMSELLRKLERATKKA